MDIELNKRCLENDVLRILADHLKTAFPKMARQGTGAGIAFITLERLYHAAGGNTYGSAGIFNSVIAALCKTGLIEHASEANTPVRLVEGSQLWRRAGEEWATGLPEAERFTEAELTRLREVGFTADSLAPHWRAR